MIDTTLTSLKHQDLSFWENMANIANIASLIGLALAIYLLLNARRLRNRYLSIVRIPQLLNKLKNIRSNISELISTNNIDETRIRTELNVCKSNLESIQVKLDRNSRNKSKILIKTIESTLNNDSIESDKIWDIYEKLAGFNEFVENIKEDLNWRP